MNNIPYRDIQSRLAKTHDNIRRKVLDNNLSLISMPTDTLRIQTVKTDEGDIKSRKLIKADVLPIVYPTMTNIPLRNVYKDEKERLNIKSLVLGFDISTSSLLFEIQCPTFCDLTVDDLLVRCFIKSESNKIEDMSVFIMKVIERYGDIGGNSIITNKYKVAPSTEQLPTQMLEVIEGFAIRRLKLLW